MLNRRRLPVVCTFDVRSCLFQRFSLRVMRVEFLNVSVDHAQCRVALASFVAHFAPFPFGPYFTAQSASASSMIRDSDVSGGIRELSGSSSANLTTAGLIVTALRRACPAWALRIRLSPCQILCTAWARKSTRNLFDSVHMHGIYIQDMSKQESIPALDNPCNTCPYRKDTPPGVWHRAEYDKLPAWDGTEMHEMNTDLFMCHSANLAGNKAICRGWLEVHSENKGVRINMMTGRITVPNTTPTTVELYESGREARRAGIRGVRKPSKKAVSAITKLVRARAAR
jgi:hypothetical protein